MRWFIILAIMVALSVSVFAQSAKDKGKDKAAAQRTFSILDKAFSAWGEQEVSQKSRDAIASLAKLISSKGIKVTRFLPDVKMVRGKSVCIVKQEHKIVSYAAFQKAITLKLAMIDFLINNPENNGYNTPSSEIFMKMDEWGQDYWRGKPEKFKPNRQSLDLWTWPTQLSFAPGPKKPLITQVKLVKENNVWKLSELQIVSYFSSWHD